MFMLALLLRASSTSSAVRARSAAELPAPHSSEAVGVLDIASGTLSTISTGDSTPYKYSGIVRSSTTGKLYLPPHDADAVGVVDMATAAFSTLPLPAAVGTTSARFSGALKLQAGGEERVLMVPYSATVA